MRGRAREHGGQRESRSGFRGFFHTTLVERAISTKHSRAGSRAVSLVHCSAHRTRIARVAPLENEPLYSATTYTGSYGEARDGSEHRDEVLQCERWTEARL